MLQKMAKILIVDDDPGILVLLRALLEREGHSVCEARDGRTALEIYRAAPPDLLVTDIVLPGKEGLDLILELERIHPGIKVLAISGGDRIEPEYYLDLAKILGARATLAKPFAPLEFLRLVRELLQGERPSWSPETPQKT